MPTIAELLATSPDALEKALCYRVVGNKHGTIDKMHTVDQALYGRNAFAKVGVVNLRLAGTLFIVQSSTIILWYWPFSVSIKLKSRNFALRVRGLAHFLYVPAGYL